MSDSFKVACRGFICGRTLDLKPSLSRVDTCEPLCCLYPSSKPRTDVQDLLPAPMSGKKPSTKIQAPGFKCNIKSRMFTSLVSSHFSVQGTVDRGTTSFEARAPVVNYDTSLRKLTLQPSTVFKILKLVSGLPLSTVPCRVPVAHPHPEIQHNVGSHNQRMRALIIPCHQDHVYHDVYPCGL